MWSFFPAASNFMRLEKLFLNSEIWSDNGGSVIEEICDGR
jgi:hypothetical protein